MCHVYPPLLFLLTYSPSIAKVPRHQFLFTTDSRRSCSLPAVCRCRYTDIRPAVPVRAFELLFTPLFATATWHKNTSTRLHDRTCGLQGLGSEHPGLDFYVALAIIPHSHHQSASQVDGKLRLIHQRSVPLKNYSVPVVVSAKKTMPSASMLFEIYYRNTTDPLAHPGFALITIRYSSSLSIKQQCLSTLF